MRCGIQGLEKRFDLPLPETLLLRLIQFFRSDAVVVYDNPYELVTY